jgi:uncharacterized protein (DUF1697 family)
MVRYVGFLRGINVGRNKRIAMADLRALAEEIGYADVVTHLQSGNLIFSSEASEDAVRSSLEDGIRQRFGMDVAVVVRSRDEIAQIVANNPLSDVATDGSRYLVAFMSGVPDARAIDANAHQPAQFRIVGRDAYLWLPDGILASKLPDAFSDKKLRVTVTTRNWNTVRKVLEIARR